MKSVALVMAGGSGLRLGTEIPKQYLPLGDTLVLGWSLRAFEKNRSIHAIVVVAQPDRQKDIAALCEKENITKLIGIAPAGEDRRGSVRSGLALLQEKQIDTECSVLIHDAARPFLPQRVIRECIAAAEQFGACGTMLPLVDTPVLSKNGETVEDMPPRRLFYGEQTPQAFRLGLLLESHDGVPADAPDITDDCALVRAMGHTVRIVRGAEQLMKITRPIDLTLARVMLEEGLQEE